MTDSYRPARVFTLEQANAALPLVRAIVTDLAQLSREVVERRERLAFLTAGRSDSAHDPYTEELVQIEEELEKDGQRLRSYVEELQELGVEPKGMSEGLVDFPSMMERRLVYLCWKLGEPEVSHWHDLDAGFLGRQSLTADSVSGGSSAGSPPSAGDH